MQIQSSSVAQKNYYLERSHEREKELIIHHFWTICYVTVSIILILSVGILFYKKARKVEEERRRILILKETTDIRLDEADKSIAQIKTDYDIIKKIIWNYTCLKALGWRNWRTSSIRLKIKI